MMNVILPFTLIRVMIMILRILRIRMSFGIFILLLLIILITFMSRSILLWLRFFLSWAWMFGSLLRSLSSGVAYSFISIMHQHPIPTNKVVMGIGYRQIIHLFKPNRGINFLDNDGAAIVVQLQGRL